MGIARTLKTIGFRDMLVFLILGAMSVAVGLAEFPEQYLNAAKKTLLVLALLQAWITLRRVLKSFVEDRIATYSQTDPARVASFMALGVVFQGLLLLFLVLFGLDNFGINISALVAGLGIGGIAVALAVQNILSDLLASFSILMDKPFVVGDFIAVGDMNGTVEAIGIKTTRVRSLSGEQLVFPNSDLLSSRIRNYKRMQQRRVESVVSVTYGTPVEKLGQIAGWIRQIIEAETNARFDRSHFQKLNAYSLDFQYVYYVLSADYNVHMDVQQKLNLALMERFEKEEVSFALPTTHVVYDAPDADLPLEAVGAAAEPRP